jgi:hypothetical protein
MATDAATLEGITPGSSRADDVRQILGDPTHTWGAAGERFVCPGLGIETVEVGYDERGAVRWARVQFVKDLSPALAAVVFWLTGPSHLRPGNSFADPNAPGWTEHYEADGVFFYVVADVVQEAWMTAPEVAIADVQTERRGMEASAARETVAEQASPLIDVPVGARLQILGVTYSEARTQDGSQRGLASQAAIQAENLNGQALHCSLRLSYRDGPALKALQGAPDWLRDEQGALCSQGQDPIRFDLANWSAFTLFIPYRQISAPAPVNHFAATFTAKCGGLTAIYQREVVVLTDDPQYAEALGTQPQVSLSVSDPVIQPHVRWQGEDSLVLQTALDAVGFRGEKVLMTLRWRRLDGRYVQAAGLQKEIWQDASGRLRIEAWAVPNVDQAVLNPFQVFIPYSRLDLPPGEHVLILELGVECNRSSLSLEKCIVLVKPEDR